MADNITKNDSSLADASSLDASGKFAEQNANEGWLHKHRHGKEKHSGEESKSGDGTQSTTVDTAKDTGKDAAKDTAKTDGSSKSEDKKDTNKVEASAPPVTAPDAKSASTADSKASQPEASQLVDPSKPKQSSESTAPAAAKPASGEFEPFDAFTSGDTANISDGSQRRFGPALSKENQEQLKGLHDVVIQAVNMAAQSDETYPQAAIKSGLEKANKSIQKYQEDLKSQDNVKAEADLTAARSTLGNVLAIAMPRRDIETRAEWIDRGKILQIGSKAGMVAYINSLPHINELYIEANSSGFAMYNKTKLLTKNPMLAAEGDWDPIQTCIDAAHARGIKVKAWFRVFAVGNTEHNQLKPLSNFPKMPSMAKWIENDTNWISPRGKNKANEQTYSIEMAPPGYQKPAADIKAPLQKTVEEAEQNRKELAQLTADEAKKIIPANKPPEEINLIFDEHGLKGREPSPEAQAAAHALLAQEQAKPAPPSPYDRDNSPHTTFNYPGPILEQHPDWALRNPDGTMLPPRQKDFFIDPANKNARAFLLNVEKELVTNYPGLAGVEWDNIRSAFTGSDRPMGFDKAGRESFKNDSKDPKNPNSTGIEISPNMTSGEREAWQNWMVGKVDSFVHESRMAVKDIKPNMLISAAIYDMSLADRMKSIQQRPEVWVANGDVDTLEPMSYVSNPNQYQSRIRNAQNMTRGNGQSAEMGRPLVIAGRIDDRVDMAAFMQEQFIAQQSGVMGINDFAASIMGQAKSDALRKGPYSKPASMTAEESPVLAGQKLYSRFAALAHGNLYDKSNKEAYEIKLDWASIGRIESANSYLSKLNENSPAEKLQYAAKEVAGISSSLNSYIEGSPLLKNHSYRARYITNFVEQASTELSYAAYRAKFSNGYEQVEAVSEPQAQIAQPAPPAPVVPQPQASDTKQSPDTSKSKEPQGPTVQEVPQAEPKKHKHFGHKD